MAERALRLAGEFTSVLDLPCGTGRFWELLFQSGTKQMIAADYSQDMLEVAAKVQPPSLLELTDLLQTSAFAIDLPDSAVGLVFCRWLNCSNITVFKTPGLIRRLANVDWIGIGSPLHIT